MTYWHNYYNKQISHACCLIQLTCYMPHMSVIKEFVSHAHACSQTFILNILVIFFLTFKFSCFVTRSFRLTTYRQQILQWNNIPLFHFNEWNIDILILIFKIISMVMKRLQLNNLKKVSAVYMWQICYFVYLIELLHYLCCWVYMK